MSHAQRRLWFLYELSRDPGEQNLVLRLRLRGTLARAALERCFDWLIARHEILRTRYLASPDGPEARCELPLPLSLAFEDLRRQPESQRSDRVRAAFAEEQRTPFALDAREAQTRAPAALRARLLRTGDLEHELIVSCPHIALDGHSAALLISELNVGYARARVGRALPATGAPPYSAFARAEPTALADLPLEAARAFFHDYLAPAKPLCWPDASANANASGGARRFSLPPLLGQRLERLAREHHTTPFLLLLTAYAVTLRHVTGQTLFAVGTDLAGRHGRDTESMLGFFVNQLMLRCDLTGDPSASELLARQRADALRAYAHERVPFDRLIGRAIAPIQVKLNHQPAFLRRDRVGDLEIVQHELAQQRGEFELVLDLVREKDGGLTALLEHAPVISAALAARIERAWLAACESLPELIARPLTELLARLSVVEQAHRQRQVARARDQQSAGLANARRRPLTGGTRTNPEEP